MYLNKDGTVLISTIIILALVSTLGTFLFKMTKNNNELSYIDSFNGDIYDLDEKEEETLKDFMQKLNNINDNDKENEVFKDNFIGTISDSVIQYDKDKNKLFLTTYISKEISRSGEVSRKEEVPRKREIKHIIKDEKIILVPTYNFKDEPYEK